MHELAAVPFARTRATDWNALSHATLRVNERAPKSAVLLKTGRLTDAAAVLAAEAGISTPQPNRWAWNGDALWLWQGPREWLLLSESEPPVELAERMNRVIGRITAAVVDVTDRVLQLDVHGTSAPRLFSKGTSLDPRQLAPGACCRTRFANLQATVLRTASSGDFTLITDRSTAVYLHSWFARAAWDLAP